MVSLFFLELLFTHFFFLNASGFDKYKTSLVHVLQEETSASFKLHRPYPGVLWSEILLAILIFLVS